MLLNTFFRADSYNPDLPAEEWTLVYEKTTAGSDTFVFDWGKYKIEISGGGGAGGAASANASGQNSGFSFYAYSGTNAELKSGEFSVFKNNSYTASITVGSGGGKSTVSVGRAGAAYSVGSAGTPNGILGEGDSENHQGAVLEYCSAAVASGSTGGVSILNIAGANYILTALGGDGGKATASAGFGNYYIVFSKNGAKMNPSNHLGAIGGAGRWDASHAESGAGANGYIRIYKSNLIPEDS